MIKRTIERTLTAENVSINIQVKHNLAFKKEYSTRITMTLKDQQITESKINKEGLIQDFNGIKTIQRDILKIEKDEIVIKRDNLITMQMK